MRNVCVRLLIFFCGLAACAQQPSFQALSDKGDTYWKTRDYRNAARTFEDALKIAEASHDIEKQLKMRGRLASAYELLGDSPKAMQFAETALALLRQNPGRNHVGFEEEYFLRFLGSLYAKQGNYALGLKNLRASLALCRAPKANCGADTGRILRDIGIALFRSGDARAAERSLRDAVASSHAFSALGKTTLSAAPTSDLELEALRWLERVLVAQHRTDEALDVAQLCRKGTLSLVLTTRLRMSSKETATAPDRERLRAVARKENATIVEYSVVYDSDPVIPLEFSDFEMLPAAAVYIWVIHPNGAIDFRQPVIDAKGFALAQFVGQVRNAITSRTPTASRDRTQALQQAYQLLVMPIEGLLPADPQARVMFVPQDTLYLLPFAALQDSAGRYLIEKHTIATEVSVEVLELSRQKFERLPAGVTAALAVGNPAMPPGYPALPGAEKEALAVAGILSSTALTGVRATKAAVMQRAGNARILHFATHGILNAAEEQFSSLVLAPDRADSGFLAAREIRTLKLNAEMAVLSACDTGQGKLTGDGVLGLGRSFVEAGVPTLVLSLWSIPDAPTAALMVEFYKDLRLGHDKAQALRNAMLATMKQFPEPRAWAAFLLLGIPDVSAVLRSVSGMPPAAGTSSYATALPVPDGARNYMQLDDNSFLFMTSMSATQIVAFYREVLKARGYREDSPLTRTEQRTFQIVFVGQSGNQRFDVGGVEFGQERAVTVRFSATH